MASYDERTALLVVDVQNDFADPGGSLSVRGGEEILPAINAEIEGAHTAGALVVYTQDWHPASTPHFQKDGGVWPVHCLGGSWGAELLPGLVVVAPAEHLRKGTGGEDGYSAFTVRNAKSGQEAPTALEGLLHEHGIERVVVGGIATDYCVKDTVLDARRLGFAATVLTDAIRPVDLKEGDGARAVAEMRDAGAELA